MVKRATLTCPLTNRAKNFKAYLSLISVLKMFQNQHYLINMKVIIFQPDSNAGLSEAIHLDMLNRAKLREIYDKILGLYNTLPVQYQKSLNSAYPDLVNYLTAKRKDLDSSDIVILVAGIYQTFIFSLCLCQFMFHKVIRLQTEIYLGCEFQ